MSCVLLSVHKTRLLQDTASWQVSVTVKVNTMWSFNLWRTGSDKWDLLRFTSWHSYKGRKQTLTFSVFFSLYKTILSTSIVLLFWSQFLKSSLFWVASCVTSCSTSTPISPCHTLISPFPQLTGSKILFSALPSLFPFSLLSLLTLKFSPPPLLHLSLQICSSLHLLLMIRTVH